jgi:hypothetical protein
MAKVQPVEDMVKMREAQDPVVGRPGVVVDSAIEIAAPAREVFDYFTDLRRESEWNPQVREVWKVTPGPIWRGDQASVRFERGVGVATIENKAPDRPAAWASMATVHSPSRSMSLEPA